LQNEREEQTTEHLTYSEMHTRPTLRAEAVKFVRKLYDNSQSNGNIVKAIDKHPKLFLGIGNTSTAK
jgi:phage portal protein BeeE